MQALNCPWYGRLIMRYVFGDFELNDQLYELRQADRSIELERKVFDVLVYLIQHQDRLVTKDELLEQLWPEQVVGEAALTRCITSARKALGDDGNRQEFIKTQHGRGYRFVAPVAASAAPVPRSEFQVPRPQEEREAQEQTRNGQQPEALSLTSISDSPVKTEQVSEELGVRYVLEGSVAKLATVC